MKIKITASLVIVLTILFSSCAKNTFNETSSVTTSPDTTVAQTTNPVITAIQTSNPVVTTVEETTSVITAVHESTTGSEYVSNITTETATATIDYTNSINSATFLIRKPELETYRNMLDPKLQPIYDDFISKISNYETFVVDFTKVNYDFEEFYMLTDALRCDYNEIRLFLETSELYSDEMYKGNPRYISVSYEYNWLIRDSFDPDFMNEYMEEINEICDEIISRMPNGTNADKYKFLGNEIIKMTYYGENDVNNVPNEEVDWSYAYLNGPLLSGKAVCQGYAYAYKYLCNRAGLWCHTVSGGCHCWNIIMLEDGSTYHVDLTWGDNGEEYIGYFLLTEEEIRIDHTPYVDELNATGKKITYEGEY